MIILGGFLVAGSLLSFLLDDFAIVYPWDEVKYYITGVEPPGYYKVVLVEETQDYRSLSLIFGIFLIVIGNLCRVKNLVKNRR